MPRGRGNRTIVGAGRPRRPMDWECGNIDAIVGGNKVCKWLIPPSELIAGYTDPTLMSTMVWLTLHTVGASTSNQPIAGFGIIVVTAFSDAAPTGDACPGPVTDCDADWVYLNFAPAVNGVVVQTTMGSELDRRSQAKRRLGNDKAILLVLEEFSGLANFNGHAHVRCLIKE